MATDIKITPRPRLPDICDPYWCGIEKYKIIKDKIVCVSTAMYNISNTLTQKAIMFQKVGLEDKVNDIYTFINKINHMVGYLCLLFFQIYMNEEDYDCYISCEELENIRKNFLCQGFDISCIYECFDICGYTKNCKKC